MTLKIGTNRSTRSELSINPLKRRLPHRCLNLKNQTRRAVKGFTLIELMITVAIVSLGTVMIYQSNMMSLNVFGRQAHRMSLQNWAEEKIWEAKEAILEVEEPDTGQTSGQHLEDNRLYDWRLQVDPTDAKEAYTVLLSISWKEGGRDMYLDRSGFVFKPKKES